MVVTFTLVLFSKYYCLHCFSWGKKEQNFFGGFQVFFPHVKWNHHHHHLIFSQFFHKEHALFVVTFTLVLDQQTVLIWRGRDVGTRKRKILIWWYYYLNLCTTTKWIKMMKRHIFLPYGEMQMMMTIEMQAEPPPFIKRLVIKYHSSFLNSQPSNK